MSFSEGVELKLACFVPQPSVCVRDFAEFDRGRKRCGVADCAFNFSHHFGGMFGGAHPAGAEHVALRIDLYLQHAHGVKQRWQLAFKNSVGVFFVQMAGGIASVSLGRRRNRHMFGYGWSYRNR